MKYDMKKQKTITEVKEDYHLFIDIQMGKYFRKRNVKEFETEKEAKVVIGQIIAAWNRYVAANHRKYDELDKAGTEAWFNSIEIKFETANEPESKAGKKLPSLKNENIRQVSDKEPDHGSKKKPA